MPMQPLLSPLLIPRAPVKPGISWVYQVRCQVYQVFQVQHITGALGVSHVSVY